MFVIDQNECFRCGLCKQACAFNAVIETRERFLIDRTACTQCKACYTACPIKAVKIRKQRHVILEEVFKVPAEQIEVIDRRAKMTLGDIMKTKTSYELFAMTPGHKVSDAIKLMNDRNISAVMVVDEGQKLKGMITERDIVRGLSKGSDFLNDRIENIMTREVITFTPFTEVSAAISVVANRKVRHLPVVDGDRIVGMITYRDLVSYVLPEIIYMAKDLY